MVKDGHLSGIIDFGLVFWEGQKRVTLLDEAVGSFMYLAPECEDGIADVTPSADIYALGKVIYFTLSGGLQFNREKHREVAYDLAIRNSDPRFEKINELLDCMICGEPADRIQNVSEVAQQIDMITQYFTNVRMERHFTIKEGELCYHAEHWHEIRPGVFSNSNNETRDWSIFGPYVIDPPLDQGLYEVSFKLRYDNSTRNNAADGYLTIDVAASENKVLGARVIAAKALSPRDLITDAKAPDSWRIHSLLFVYLGQEDIEFRVLKDNPLRLGSPYGHSTVEFGGVALRQIAAGRTGS